MIPDRLVAQAILAGKHVHGLRLALEQEGYSTADAAQLVSKWIADSLQESVKEASPRKRKRR
jgi:hypothetical protein